MLIIGINGSPHHDGNAKALVDVALSQAGDLGAETKVIQAMEVLNDMKTPFCTVCTNPCAGVCSKGNKLGEALDLLRKADGVFLASPVYFGSVTGQIKAFWDVTRFIRGEKALLNVVGAALTVGASRFGGQETTIKALHDMMLVQGMTIIGDGHLEADAGHHGTCSVRPAAEDQYALQRTRILAKRMVELAEVTKGLRKRG